MSAPTGSSLTALRDRAIMELFFSTGLRVSELCSLSRDLDLSRDEFFRPRQRREGARRVPLARGEESDHRLPEGAGDIEDALFISYGRGGKPRAIASRRGRWSG